MTDYTELAQQLNEAYVRAHPFHGPIISMDGEAEFSLRDAADLINQAQQNKEQYLRSKARQQHANAIVGQARQDVSLLPDAESQRKLVEQGIEQAKRYCQSKNAGATPRSFDPNNKDQVDIRNGVLGWLKKQRARGHYPRTTK